MNHYAAEGVGISRSVPAAGLGGGRQGERQRKPGPLAFRAVARDGAAVLLDDPVRDREAESRALAELLRREERVVDSGHLIGRDARTGVPDLDVRDVAVDAGDDRQPAA